MTDTVVKQSVKVEKMMADRSWGERLGNKYDGNENMFLKEVKLLENVRRQGTS